MLPKKIYLAEQELQDTITCERMVSIDEPYRDMTEEYTNLSQVWHDANEEPEEETWILATNEKDIIDVYHLRKGRKYNFDGNLIDWSKFVVNFNLTKWAYIDDLLPKGGKDGFKSIL